MLAGIGNMCPREARPASQSRGSQFISVYDAQFPPAHWRNNIFFFCILMRSIQNTDSLIFLNVAICWHICFPCRDQKMKRSLSEHWKEEAIDIIQAPRTQACMWPHPSFCEVLQKLVILSVHSLTNEKMWLTTIPVHVAFIHYSTVTFVD